MIFYVNKENHLMWNLETDELAIVTDYETMHVYKDALTKICKIISDTAILETVAPLKSIIKIDIIVNTNSKGAIANIELKNRNYTEKIDSIEKLQAFMKTFNIIWFVREPEEKPRE